MTVEELLTLVKESPEQVEFADVIAVIDANYSYTPTSFSNGSGELRVESAAGQNVGSCKIFSFAKKHNLSEEETLHCFGKYYREDVLLNPQGKDHGNIRAFIEHGWKHLRFEGDPLS